LNKRSAGGVAGALACSVLVGVSFLFIKTFLFTLNTTALSDSFYFYVFLGSLVGVAGSLFAAFAKASNLKVDGHEPNIKVSSEKIGSSGALGSVIKLGPGTRLMNNGLDMKLENETLCWPILDGSMAPEEPKIESNKERRFFETVYA
jgi:hypothetical protein